MAHGRPQVGTADADIDHVADALAAGAGPAAVANALAESGPAFEHGMPLGHHVLAVDLDPRSERRAPRNLPRRPPLRGVHVRAGEHPTDPRTPAAGPGHPHQPT